MMKHQTPRPNRATVPLMFQVFETAWRETYHQRYVGFGPKLGKIARRLLEAWPELTIQEFTIVVRSYLADQDRYLLDRRHPFEVLCSSNRINQYRVASQPTSIDRDRDRFINSAQSG